MTMQTRDRLKQLREAMGMTQPDLARLINHLRPGWKWHQTTVAKIESGDRSIKLDDLQAYAEIAQMSIGTLVGYGLDKTKIDLDASGEANSAIWAAVSWAADVPRTPILLEIKWHEDRIAELQKKLSEIEDRGNG